MVSEKMGLPFCRGRGRGRGCGCGRGCGFGRRRRRTVDDTNFWKNDFFNNLLWKNYTVNFHKIFRVC